MDNEAGMEHISRLTTKNVDILLIVSDTSRRGLQAALRIYELAGHLQIGVGRSYLVVNRAEQDLGEPALDMVRKAGLELAGTIPADEAVSEFDFEGRPTVELPEEAVSVRAAFEIFDRIIS